MTRWGVPKGVMHALPKRGKSGKSDGGVGLTVPGVERLTKELAQESGRVPPEARADLALIQVHLTRKTVPDEDAEQTLLKWLAERGFHDVLALRADASFELSKRKREGLDLCLWVDPERLLRAAITKDPTRPPKHAKDLSNEERTSLVQAATSVLAEAKENKILSYKEIFLFHEQNTLGGLLRLQGPYRMFWDRGDVLLDAIASYFGTKVGYYFAWLKFYTAALVFPTVVGLLVWWTERVNSLAESSGTCVQVQREQACDGGSGVACGSWWRWPVAVATSLADSSVRSASSSYSAAAAAAAAAAAGVVQEDAGEEAVTFFPGGGGGADELVGGGGDGEWDPVPVGCVECEPPTSMAPYFNLFLAVWATLFLVLWQRRSSTLAFRWGVHKEDTIERAKFMVGWKRPGRAGMTPEGALQRQTSFSSSTSTSTATTFTGSTDSIRSTDSVRSSSSGSAKMLARAGLRRQCATGCFRATAAAAATDRAAAAAAAAAATAPASKRSWSGTVGRGGGGGGGGRWSGGASEVREDGLEGGAWEPLRTARLFLSWSLEAVLLYLAIRMMLWFAWLEVRSLEKFGGGSFGVRLVRTASVILPSTFYGMHWKWAHALTTWEDHVTEAGAENSMTVKRFTFRCVNSYARLFYLGFWQRDLDGLKEMLMTVLITRSFMDALQEVVAPMIQVYWRTRLQRATAPTNGAAFVTHKQQHMQQQQQGPARRRGWLPFSSRQQPQEQKNRRNPEVSCRRGEIGCAVKKLAYRKALMHERMLPEYQTQREYLDLMVQYGYVTMFAVAYPLAPLLALVRCLAEIYIDHRKLLRCRRPAYVDRSSIGAWYGVLEFVGNASVLTNCLLLALTAEKLRMYVPMPLVTQFPNTKYIVMAVFAEHMILGVKATVRILIDDVPDGVEKAMAEELLHDQEESRRKVEDALGFSEDVASTHVTIIRQQQQQQTRQVGRGDVANGNGYRPSTPDRKTRGGGDSSRTVGDISASSVHMLSSSPSKAATTAAVERRETTSVNNPQQQQKQKQQQLRQRPSNSGHDNPFFATPPVSTPSSPRSHTSKQQQQQQQQQQPPRQPPPRQQLQQQQQPKPKPRRRIWSRRSSPTAVSVFPGDDNGERNAEEHGSSENGFSANDPRLLPLTLRGSGSEDGRGGGRRHSDGGGGSPGGWSDVGASRGRAVMGKGWGSASVDGGEGGSSQWKEAGSAAAMRRSVFSQSGTGPRRRISFRSSGSSS